MVPGVSSGRVSDFEDFIDGYFPLNVSIRDLMRRRGLDHARLVLTQAPIMHIPGLALHEPVPLSLKAGRAGLIEHMDIRVDVQGQGCALGGTARWRWLDGTHPDARLDPNTRLAEPAFLHGQALAEPSHTPRSGAFIHFERARQST